jgi:uncharacterized membrane protein YecN with MAPEG domain
MDQTMMAALAPVALYAGLNILVLMALALHVVGARVRHKVLIGDGGVEEVLRAIRAHANAVEYVPVILVGLAVLALSGAPGWLVHASGAALTLGRVLHGVGLNANAGTSFGRAAGTLLTWAAMLAVAVGLVWTAITTLT